MLTMQGGDSLVGGLPIIHITYQQYIANPSAYQDPDVIVHISGFPTAGNMPADYVGYDSNLNMEDIGNIATKAIAKVEPSDTALYLHNVGTGFINKDGNYCITDVQISVGGTITLGTNCHVVDGGISGNLTDINSDLLHAEWAHKSAIDTSTGTKTGTFPHSGVYVIHAGVQPGALTHYVILNNGMRIYPYMKVTASESEAQFVATAGTPYTLVGTSTQATVLYDESGVS